MQFSIKQIFSENRLTSILFISGIVLVIFSAILNYDYIMSSGVRLIRYVASFLIVLSLFIFFMKKKGKWELARESALLSKRHNLQGPIDDAFMDSFIFVSPTGKSKNPIFSKWAKSEEERAIVHWRRHFRGDAVVKQDKELKMADIINNNLILWGDPQSNAFIKKIIKKLPIKWTEKVIEVNGKSYDAANHGLIMIYPNPLSPNHYIVFNSGFTYRDYAYLNNARQVPMLPDWAVIDLRTPPNAVWPGKVVKANFFDEFWRVK